MRCGKWMAILAAASLLAGCKDFWKAPSDSGGDGGGTGASSGAFYVANQATNEIAAYSIASGTLTKISGSPYSLSVAPRAFAVSPNGNALYVGTLGAGIFVYTIGSGGALTIGNNGQAISSDLAFALQVDPSGSWLVDAFPTFNGAVQVDAIPITSAGTVDLSRTEQTPTAFTGASVNELSFSPDGGHVFIALGTTGTLVMPFASGNASPLGVSNAFTIRPLNTGGSALSVAVDPTNRLFYIGESLANSSANSGGLRVFNYSSLGGTLTEAGGSPIASGGLAPNAILPLATGDYVYVANGQGTSNAGNVQGFAITTGGTATSPTYSIASSGSSVAAGIQPVGIAEDSQGNYVLVVSSGGNPDLAAFTISSGVLKPALTSATGNDPVGAGAIAALPK